MCVQNLPPEFQKLVLRPFAGFNLRAPLVAVLSTKSLLDKLFRAYPWVTLKTSCLADSPLSKAYPGLIQKLASALKSYRFWCLKRFPN